MPVIVPTASHMSVAIVPRMAALSRVAALTLLAATLAAACSPQPPSPQPPSPQPPGNQSATTASTDASSPTAPAWRFVPSCPLRYAIRVDKGSEMETPNGPLGGETMVVEADVALEAHGPLVALDAASLRMALQKADGTRAPWQESKELPEILLDNHATWLESTGEEPSPSGPSGRVA